LFKKQFAWFSKKNQIVFTKKSRKPQWHALYPRQPYGRIPCVSVTNPDRLAAVVHPRARGRRPPISPSRARCGRRALCCFSCGQISEKFDFGGVLPIFTIGEPTDEAYVSGTRTSF